MYLSKDILGSASYIGTIDIDPHFLEDIPTVPLDEEIARLICSVSNRPGRHRL